MKKQWEKHIFNEFCKIFPTSLIRNSREMTKAVSSEIVWIELHVNLNIENLSLFQKYCLGVEVDEYIGSSFS